MSNQKTSSNPDSRREAYGPRIPSNKDYEAYVIWDLTPADRGYIVEVEPGKFQWKQVQVQDAEKFLTREAANKVAKDLFLPTRTYRIYKKVFH